MEDFILTLDVKSVTKTDWQRKEFELWVSGGCDGGPFDFNV